MRFTNYSSALTLAVYTVACTGIDPNYLNNGGASAVGGSTASVTTGGSSSTSGAETAATGGTTTTGGQISTGGLNATGGSLAGGEAATGSSVNTGGNSAITCNIESATQCKNSSTLQTCTGGAWIDSACGNFEACARGACRQGCAELTVATGTPWICYMPVDPYGSYNGAPQTLRILSSDSTILKPARMVASAWDTRNTYSSGGDDTFANVETDPLGLIWSAPESTEKWGRLYLWGEMDLSAFAAKFGAAPKTITMYIKALSQNSSLATPIADFTLTDGVPNLVNSEFRPTWFSLQSDWQLQTREFHSDEIAALSLDGSLNTWEVDIVGDVANLTPPRVVQVSWFALVFGVTN